MADVRAILIESPTLPGMPGLFLAAGTITSDGTPRVITIDNIPCKGDVVVFVNSWETAAGANPVIVYAAIASGTLSGKKATFTVPASSTCRYLIIDSQTETLSAKAVAADTTFNLTR